MITSYYDDDDDIESIYQATAQTTSSRVNYVADTITNRPVNYYYISYYTVKYCSSQQPIELPDEGVRVNA
jgi:hypothetical protein